MEMAALTGIRVLDLANSRADLAGRMLADLGAEVLKIEPSEGVDSRHMGPFDRQNNSLYWTFIGIGKSSLILNLQHAEDRDSLKDLVKGADILIESFEPGYAASIGIGYDTLKEINPGLIYIAISPFGQKGPKSNWPATDLTIEAAGGRVAMQGDKDRPPIPIGFPQTYLQGGAQAAADLLIALNEREKSGLGQFLDLSLQEVVWWTLMSAQGSPVCMGRNPPGFGDDRAMGTKGRGQFVPQLTEASDGWVAVGVGANPPGKKGMTSYAVDEARDQGELEEDLHDYDWDDWVNLLQQNEITQDQLIRVMDHVRAYIKKRSKQELVAWALENDLRLGPLNTTHDLVHDAHFNARGFYIELAGVKYPGPWVKMSGTPLTITRPAPTPGQHEKPDWQQRTISSSAAPRSGNAFEGLKVADFSWVAAGPTIAKALADHGATVVKLESATRLDLSRTLVPHLDKEPGVNRSYWIYLYATSKLSLQCNLATDAGRILARKMCDWADVVIESFSPGTMAKMGLDYGTLSENHPDLIMLSTSMLGQTGPLSNYAGYGQQAAGFAGFQNITGWPDRDPCGVYAPYTDAVAPKFGISALAAALYEKNKSGKGQLIDLAQAECSLYLLAPIIMDEIVNGKTAVRPGMDSIYACPQGTYPTEGTERYIAIAIEKADQWQSLRSLAPLTSFADPKFDSMDERRAVRDEINACLANWTSEQDPWKLEKLLIEADIPASVVQRPVDVFNDPQIDARQLKQTLTQKETGDVVHFGFCTRFSAKEQMVRTAPPSLGEHNDHVLRDLLQLPDDEIEELYKAGVIE